MNPEDFQRVQQCLAKPGDFTKKDLLRLLDVLQEDHFNLLSLGRVQERATSIPPKELRPNPLELGVSVSFHKVKQGYLSSCGGYELHKFGSRWTLEEVSSGEKKVFFSEREAIKEVRLIYCVVVMDRMWNYGYEIRKEALPYKEALQGILCKGEEILNALNLRVQDESLERVAAHITNLFVRVR